VKYYVRLNFSIENKSEKRIRAQHITQFFSSMPVSKTFMLRETKDTAVTYVKCLSIAVIPKLIVISKMFPQN